MLKVWIPHPPIGQWKTNRGRGYLLNFKALVGRHPYGCAWVDTTVHDGRQPMAVRCQTPLHMMLSGGLVAGFSRSLTLTLRWQCWAPKMHSSLHSVTIVCFSVSSIQRPMGLPLLLMVIWIHKQNPLVVLCVNPFGSGTTQRQDVTSAHTSIL